MTDQDFATTLLVDRNPKEVFNAINNVRGWWSEAIEGSTDKLAGEFTYRYRDVHRCKLGVTELVPDTKIVWLVLDNYFNFTRDKSEWKGTRISCEISPRGDKTEIRFSHLGLIPAYECYDVCSNAWGSYIHGSLRNLIMTGKGQPNRTENEVGEKAGRKP